MIDREKVIKGCELLKDFLGDGLPGKNIVFNSYINIVNDAIGLLKEQEPKKIIRKQMSYDHPDGAITYYAEWHCPHCNKVVQKGFDSPWLKYCFNCGKPILWD